MSTHTRDHLTFSSDPDFDFQIRTAIGRAAAGAGEVGEILAATQKVRKNDHEAWCDAWLSLADRTAATANSSAAGGHRVSAAEAYLRASAYYSIAVDALSALNDTERLHPTFMKQQAAWASFLADSGLDVTRFEIRCAEDALPGMYFRSALEDAPPTLVLVNGSDGAMAGLWAIIQPALARGYNVVTFDGPGQQSQLFERGVPFRPDWEHVVSPVLDAVLDLDGVTADRVAIYGISQGGYWVGRAIAFDHRFAAAIVDPGVVDVSTSWVDHLPHSLVKLLDEGEIEKFDKEMTFAMRFSPETARTWAFRSRPYGTSGYGETIQAVRRYTITDVAKNITTPLLILDPENEPFWPGQADRLAALAPTVSHVMRFTADEGADGHCEPLARTLTAQRMFDWLDDQLSR